MRVGLVALAILASCSAAAAREGWIDGTGRSCEVVCASERANPVMAGNAGGRAPLHLRRNAQRHYNSANAPGCSLPGGTPNLRAQTYKCLCVRQRFPAP
jgi:hypothetical protein